MQAVNCEDYSIYLMKISAVPITYSLSKSDDTTTETEDIAMAAEAIHGRRDMPRGTNTPERKPPT